MGGLGGQRGKWWDEGDDGAEGGDCEGGDCEGGDCEGGSTADHEIGQMRPRSTHGRPRSTQSQPRSTQGQPSTAARGEMVTLVHASLLLAKGRDHRLRAAAPRPPHAITPASCCELLEAVASSADAAAAKNLVAIGGLEELGPLQLCGLCGIAAAERACRDLAERCDGCSNACLAHALRHLAQEVDGALVADACRQQDCLERRAHQVNATVCDAYLATHGHLPRDEHGQPDRDGVGSADDGSESLASDGDSSSGDGDSSRSGSEQSPREDGGCDDS